MANTMREVKPKIGVYFGTFDPIHEEHIRVVKAAMQSAELDEVLIAPNMNSIEKPNASDPKHRIAMTVLRAKKEPGLNVYTGDSASLVDKFGRDPFLERIGQIYGTKKLYQVIGQDSFEKLVEQGKINPESNRLYLVSPRAGLGKALVIPDHLKEVAAPIPGYPLPPLSSTEIRKKIQDNTRPSESELDPAVYEYIRKHNLYQ